MRRARNIWILTTLVVVVAVVATLDTGRAQSAYSNYSLLGVYRIAYSGINLPEGTLESGVGIYVADGVGNITGTEVLNLPGVFCPDVKITATYSIAPNGLGSLSAQFSSPVPGCSGAYQSSLLLSEGGNVVRAVANSTTFVVLSEEWRRD